MTIWEKYPELYKCARMAWDGVTKEEIMSCVRAKYPKISEREWQRISKVVDRFIWELEDSKDRLYV